MSSASKVFKSRMVMMAKPLTILAGRPDFIVS